MTRIKICGITSTRDALAAVEAGADYLGFIFAPSPRRVDRSTVKEIIAALPAGMKTVGVFVDAGATEIRETLDSCGLNYAQLHGSEPAEVAQEVGADRVWKAFRIRSSADLEQVQPFSQVVAGILLDAYAPGLAGGTGCTFDWRLISGAPRYGVPLILAGGLSPRNAADAVRQVRPDVVDVSSGVESSPGQKDGELMRAFIKSALSAEF